MHFNKLTESTRSACEAFGRSIVKFRHRIGSGSRALIKGERNSAFTLTELLVVMAIIVLLTSLMGPMLNSALRGTNLTQGAEKVIGVLNLARQTAVTRNTTVEVRFYTYVDPEIPGDKKTGHALQIFTIDDTGTAAPIIKAQALPQTVLMTTNNLWSTLFNLPVNTSVATNAPPSFSIPIPRVSNNYSYYAFQFNRSGTTSLTTNSTATPWSVTILNAVDALTNPTTLPANYTTVVLDPYNGSLKIFRPTL